MPTEQVSCRFCGSVPARDVTFRGHQGILIVMRWLSVRGPFCRDCGLAVFRDMTGKTLWQGWWGLISFCVTPFILLINAFRRGRVANLAAPRPHPTMPSQPPMNPGRPLVARVGTWIGPLIALTLIAIIAIG